MCVTKELYLDSISICHIPCNPEAQFVVKGDTMTEESNETITNKLDELTGLVKSLGDTTKTLSETLQKEHDKCDESKDEKKEDNEDIKKSIDSLTSLVNSIDTRLKKLEDAPVSKAVITIDQNGAPVTQAPDNQKITSFVRHMYAGSKL